MLVKKARANRQWGGREKGWSNLTKAERVHVRAEIAKAAAVSTGNVTKVKQLNETCVPELIAAVYGDAISIHWAWKLRNESREDQLDALGRFRFEKGLLKDVRKLATIRQRARSSASQDTYELVKGLTQLAGARLQGLRVGVIKGSSPAIFITEELARMIGMEQRKLWNQGAVYNNSRKHPRAVDQDRNPSCGPRQFRENHQMPHACTRS